MVIDKFESPKNDYVIEGDIFFPCNGKVSVTDVIDPGIYRVVPSPKQMDKRIGLRFISKEFDLGVDKIYSTGGEEIQEVIKKTWNDSRFQKRGGNLCAIFSGIKGTGKTITAKQLCNYYATRYPVLILDDPFDGNIVEFIQSLDIKCVLFIDEAEKTFCDSAKTDLLKICDGAMNMAPKIVLMTMNNLLVDNNLLSRPGRVRYIKTFNNLAENTCKEILNDSLEDKALISEILTYLGTLETVTIDIVQSIIEEANIYGNLKTVKKFMNIDKAVIDTDCALFNTFIEEGDLAILMKYSEDYVKRHGGSIRQAFSTTLEAVREDFPEQIADLSRVLKKYSCGSNNLYEIMNKGLIFFSNTDRIGIVKFEPGCTIPGIGKVINNIQGNFYNIEVNLSGINEEIPEVDPDCYDDELYGVSSYEGLTFMLKRLESFGQKVEPGMKIVMYLRSTPPISAYRWLTV